MAIAVIASNTSAYNSIASSLSVSITYTPLENDVLVLYFSCTNTLAAGTPSGWTDPLGSSPTPGDSSTQGFVRLHVVTSAEEAAVTNSWNMTGMYSGTEAGRYWIVAVRGANPTTPNDGAGSWFTATDTETSHRLASIAGAGLSSGSLVVRFVHSDGASRTYTTPAGHTKLQDGGTNNGGWAGYRVALTTAGVNVAEETTTVSIGDEGVSISIAIMAAATTANVHTKVSGTFGDNTVKVKAGGVFTAATVKNKSGGVWV